MTQPGSLSNQAPRGNAELVRRIEALERAVRERGGANSLANASIPTGGTTTVNGGVFQLTDITGTVLFRVGPQLYGDRGSQAVRADGSVAWKIAKLFAPTDTQQRYQQYDPAGRIIGGDSQLSPTGFDSPHVPLVWRPVDRSDAKTTTSATFVSLFEHRGIRGNPGLPIQFSVLCSDATTAGEVQVIDTATGSPLAPFFAAPWVGTIAAGTTTATLLTAAALLLPGAANDAYTLQIQARRTAGTGSVSIAVAGSVGGGL